MALVELGSSPNTTRFFLWGWFWFWVALVFLFEARVSTIFFFFLWIESGNLQIERKGKAFIWKSLDLWFPIIVVFWRFWIIYWSQNENIFKNLMIFPFFFIGKLKFVISYGGVALSSFSAIHNSQIPRWRQKLFDFSNFLFFGSTSTLNFKNINVYLVQFSCGG